MISLRRLTVFLVSMVVSFEGLLAQTSFTNMVVRPVVKETVSSFPLGSVQLLNGPFKEIKDKTHAYLLSWNTDSLLHWHRVAAGLKPKAGHYLGWESGGSNILGHYLTAISLMYSTTRDEALLTRVNYIVGELAECQRAAKDGAVFNGPNFRESFEQMRKGKFEYKIIGPEFPLVNGGNFFYGIHKNIAGLRDAYLFAGNKEAKEVLIKYIDWIDDFVNAVPEEEFQRVLDVEHGGMTEVVADVYAMTGDKKYARLAEKFVHKKVALPIAENRDILFPHHANAKIPQFVGYARLYKLLGEEAAKEGKSAFNFYDIVLHNHTLANGGNSEYERFGPAGQVSKRIGMSASETCNTYNMLKLSNELYTMTGKKEYFDYYERAMYNHLLASVSDRGMYCYYVSMKPGWFKTFSTPFHSNWCCVGSGMENPGKYEENIYAHDEKTLYVNLFIPSQLKWVDQHFSLSQQGRFPETDTVVLNILESGKETGLRLRRPSWVASEPTVWVNNKPYPVKTKNGYLDLGNVFRKGDVIKVRFPMQLRVEATPDNPNIASIFYGPILLAGELGKKGLENRPLEAEDAWGLINYPQMNDIPVFIVDKQSPSSWIKQDKNSRLAFRAAVGNNRTVVLKPFYAFDDERYSVYWDMYSPAEWANYKKLHDMYIIDEVKIGDPSCENSHHIKSENSKTAKMHFKQYRSADSSWFSYDVSTSGKEPLFLVVKYWGGGWGAEPSGSLDIYVNNTKIATKDLGDKSRQTVFYDVCYEIPSTLIKGRRKSTIRFQAAGGKTEVGIFGLKISTANGLTLRELLKDQ